MYRKEVNERSPMRVFEKSMHGGLGRGNVGLVAARPGVGKTPVLVQIALDDLLRDRKVLHISHEHAVDHVRAYYDESSTTSPRARPWTTATGSARPSRAAASIKTYKDGAAFSLRLEEAVALFTEHMKLVPAAILIDGYDCPPPGSRRRWPPSRPSRHA